MNSIIPCHRVSAGPYTLELPPNGVAILYEADPSGGTGISQVPGGVGYLEALVQFAGEVIRLRAMIESARAGESSMSFAHTLAEERVAELRETLTAAWHALESYARHNGSSELAEEIAAQCRRTLDAALCDDCPPVGYPTDKTRCLPCPRR